MNSSRFLLRWFCIIPFVASAAVLAADTDGDGVDDSEDVCCQTPAGLPVDERGRPVADLDGDCDVDLVDFSIFQFSFTGPMTPCCVPICTGRVCGDDGCGGSCGTCGGSEVCNETTGQCESV